MNKEDMVALNLLAKNYFDGLYTADVEKLSSVFHRDCVLKAPGIRRTLDEWLRCVAERDIPIKQGDTFDFQLLGIEILGEQSMIKVYCPLLGNTYIDYLGCLKENNQWLIVNKMYAEAKLEDQDV